MSGSESGSATPAEITVVVVTWNGAHLLRRCLDSLRAQSVEHRTLVVDNASTDGTAQLLAAEYPEAAVLQLAANTGFAGGAQAGLDAAGTPLVALLNNDAVADPDWLLHLRQTLLADPMIAAATSRMLLARNGRINNAGGALTRLGVGYDRGLDEPDGPRFDTPVDVAAFCGGASLLRAAPARAVGGFSTEFFLYYEDTDLSWRLGRAGYRIAYAPAARVDHEHSASTDQSSELFAYFIQRNQLLTVLRNAPARVVALALGRFLAVTAFDMIRSTRRRPSTAQHRVRHRLRVLAGVLRLAPRQLRARWAQRSAPVSRRAFAARWLGSDA